MLQKKTFRHSRAKEPVKGEKKEFVFQFSLCKSHNDDESRSFASRTRSRLNPRQNMDQSQNPDVIKDIESPPVPTVTATTTTVTGGTTAASNANPADDMQTTTTTAKKQTGGGATSGESSPQHARYR